MELTSGTLLERGKYRIIETLGRGGFGITYLAEQVMVCRKVCIKEFFPKDYYKRDAGGDTISLFSQSNAEVMGRYKAKFIKEAQTIASLDHDNIIHIHDVFEENGTAYYVMDYIDGESLGAIVKRSGALDEVTAVGYIRQVAEALNYIHSLRIMHLDVKPGNIMLRRADCRAILIDFGLSKHYDDKSGEATSTTPVGMSHGYAPMEQYQTGGVNTFSPATDIYSLGATLYYLVTGCVPPEAAKLVADPIDVPLSISPSVSNAINSAMNLSPKHRPQSIKEFLVLLDADSEVVVLDNVADVDDAVTMPILDTKPVPQSKPKSKGMGSLWFILPLFIVVAVVSLAVLGGGSSKKVEPKGEVEVECVVESSPVADILLDELIAKVDEDSVNCEIAEAAVLDPVYSESLDTFTFSIDGVSLKMIWVEGGTFTMGSDDIRYDDEKPLHKVRLDGYWIAQTEVTQALWEAVMGRDKAWSAEYGVGPNYPAYYVSYNEAIDFCEKLSARLYSECGVEYNISLPTEAQWEYAARGGSWLSSYTYSGSDINGDVAWYRDNSGGKTHPVMSKNVSNRLGLYDMSGNVWEWCLDWYDANYYYSSPDENPEGPEVSRDCRVLRGGSMGSDSTGCRVANRRSNYPDYSSYNLGFRIVAR